VTGAHLRGRYPIAVAIALLGLCPNTVVSTSFLPLESRLQQDLGAGRVAVGVVLGLSSAGYAVGAVLAAQRVLRHTARRVFLGGELLFVVASAASALAPDLPVFALGRVLAGLAAGAMLISALPPLVTRFGAARVALSAAIVNVGLFGVSALGPLIGGLVTGGDGWRWLLGATALLGLIGLAVAHDGYEPFDPPEPERPVDVTALLLVVVATVATFLAASLVAGSSVRAPEVWLPFVIGMIALAALLAVEVRRHDALIPVSALTTQLPVTGLIVAMVGGACFVATAELLQTQLMTGRSAAQAALLFWPAPVGAALASVAFWRLFATRWVPVLVDVGLVALAGGVVLLLTDSSTPAAVLPAVLLLGIGAGARRVPRDGGRGRSRVDRGSRRTRPVGCSTARSRHRGLAGRRQGPALAADRDARAPRRRRDRRGRRRAAATRAAPAALIRRLAAPERMSPWRSRNGTRSSPDWSPWSRWDWSWVSSSAWSRWWRPECSG
jgi:MFS family permease